MAAKLKFYENKVGQLEAENHKLQSSVQNLEGELGRVQGNFTEVRHSGRQLEKDLKQKTNLITKYEQQIADLRGSKLKVGQLEVENHKLQTSIQNLEGELEEIQDTAKEVRQLEKDLQQKTNLITKYEQQITGSVGKPNF